MRGQTGGFCRKLLGLRFLLPLTGMMRTLVCLFSKNGRVCPTNYEQPQAHDFMNFPLLSKQGISQIAADFYESGLSLDQIAKHLNCSKALVRKSLQSAGVVLRPSCQNPHFKKINPPNHRTGVPPFGYRILRGRLILDAREIQIVHLVMNLWTAGQSYSAIAKHLNNQGVKNRKATPWDHSLVRSIVERHKDKPLVLKEE